MPDDRREDIDDEPENDKPEVVVRPDNRVAWLSDIDSLINFDRKRSSKRMFKVMGEALGEIIAEIIAETKNDLRREFGCTPDTPDAQAALRVEIAELKAALAEARAETRELKLIQESMRTASRGNAGSTGRRLRA